MTRDEAKKIVRIMKATYPSYHKNEQMLSDATEVWATVFAGAPAQAVEEAVHLYISQPHEFAPTPGQINQIMFDLAHPDILTEQDAWALVVKAFGNSLYGSEVEFKKLPADVQRAIGSPVYLQETALHGNLSVEEALFSKRYRAVIERRRDSAVTSKVNRPALPDRANEKKEYESLVDAARRRFEQLDMKDDLYKGGTN